jgi:hypothetical protein
VTGGQEQQRDQHGLKSALVLSRGFQKRIIFVPLGSGCNGEIDHGFVFHTSVNSQCSDVCGEGQQTRSSLPITTGVDRPPVSVAENICTIGVGFSLFSYIQHRFGLSKLL